MLVQNLKNPIGIFVLQSDSYVKKWILKNIIFNEVTAFSLQHGKAA